MAQFSIVGFRGFYNLARGNHHLWLGKSGLFAKYGFPDERDRGQDRCIPSLVNIGPGKLIRANIDQVICFKSDALNTLFINKRSISAIQVAHDKVMIFPFQARVLPRNGSVLDNNSAEFRTATYRYW